MSKLFESINSKVYHLKGESSEDIIKAEEKLGIHFSDEFRNYLMEYGVVSFGNHEFMGLGGPAYLNVVSETLHERTNNRKFPRNCYIVENLGIDGIFVLQDEDGIVYELSDAGLKKVFEKLKDYVVSIS